MPLFFSHLLDSSEALKYAGALEYVPEENIKQIQQVKNSVVDVVDKFRVQVRRRLNPANIREGPSTLRSGKTRWPLLALRLGALWAAFCNYLDCRRNEDYRKGLIAVQLHSTWSLWVLC